MDKKALVKIHLFSGRRNPEWAVTEKATGEFLHLWHKAEESTEPRQPVSALGYTGISISIHDSTYHVYNGTAVLLKNEKPVEVKLDAGNKMEKLLLREVPEEVKGYIKKG